MPCGESGSLHDISGKKIQESYGRLVQAIPQGTAVNQERTETPVLYDGRGNRINGVKFQEAFERDENGNVQPTSGPFLDWFWEEDDEGNKQPRDIKFWLDDNLNLQVLPEDKSDIDPEPYTGKVQNSSYDFKRTFVTSDYNVRSDDHLISVDTSSNELTLTFPSASIGNQSYIVKDEGFNIQNKNVTLKSVDPSDKFEDDEDELTLSTKGTSVTIYSNGNNKYFIV